MKRFFNKNDEFFFDNEDDNEPERINTDMDNEDIVEIMHADLVHMELDHQLMDKAIAIASKDIFWYLRSPLTKVKAIELIYNGLIDTIDGVEVDAILPPETKKEEEKKE
jgi:hypothetical protein